MKAFEANWNSAAERWDLLHDNEEWSVNKPRVVGGRIIGIVKTAGFPPMVQIKRFGRLKPAWLTFYIDGSKLGDASEGDSIWAVVIPQRKSPCLTCIDFGKVG